MVMSDQPVVAALDQNSREPGGRLSDLTVSNRAEGVEPGHIDDIVIERDDRTVPGLTSTAPFFMAASWWAAVTLTWDLCNRWPSEPTIWASPSPMVPYLNQIFLVERGDYASIGPLLITVAVIGFAIPLAAGCTAVTTCARPGLLRRTFQDLEQRCCLRHEIDGRRPKGLMRARSGGYAIDRRHRNSSAESEMRQSCCPYRGPRRPPRSGWSTLPGVWRRYAGVRGNGFRPPLPFAV